MTTFLRPTNVARFAIFVVYFWFGILKVVGLSPATELVHALFDQTLAAFIPFNTFFLLFALFEVAIGVMYLFPKFDKVSFPLLLLHLFLAAGPLVLLPAAVWTQPLVPTLEGQYIIKNILILSAAWTIYRGGRT